MRDIFRPNMTSRACVTRRKVDFVNNYSTRVNADQETWKGRTRIKDIGGRRPLFQKESVPTKDAIVWCKSEQQSHLGRRGTRKMIFYKIVGRKIAKQIAGSSVGLQQDKDWTLWRGRPPPKWKKKETSSRGGTGNTEAPASPERVNECETMGLMNSGSCKCSGRAPLDKGADVIGVTPHRRCQQNT
jgi:hypothetical protein